MNWFTKLFTPSPPEPPESIGPFARGVLNSVETNPGDWEREGNGFRHIPTSMTMETLDVGDHDEILMTVRLNPRQDVNDAERDVLMQACSYLGTAIRKREEAEIVARAAGVRVHFESP